MKYSALFDNGQNGGIEEIEADSPEDAMEIAAAKVRENCAMSCWEVPVMVEIRNGAGETLLAKEVA